MTTLNTQTPNPQDQTQQSATQNAQPNYTHTHANVDAAEVAKFNDLAEKWWDTTAEFAPLHKINPLRLNWIDQHANGLAGKKVLDVGCGGGILAESMARRGADVLGIDMGEAPLAVAKIHAAEQGVTNINYQQTPVEALVPEMAGEFDVVTCMEMLEHVPDPSSIVAACQKLVKPNGLVVFSTINRNPKSYLFAIIGAEYVLRLLPRGTHEHSKFIKPSELAGFARAVGLELFDSSGLHYNPITKHYWLAPNMDVNYMLATRNTA